MPRYGRKERDFTGASMTGHDTAGAAGLWISDVLRPVGHGLENDRFREGRRRDREKKRNCIEDTDIALKKAIDPR